MYLYKISDIHPTSFIAWTFIETSLIYFLLSQNKTNKCQTRMFSSVSLRIVRDKQGNQIGHKDPDLLPFTIYWPVLN